MGEIINVGKDYNELDDFSSEKITPELKKKFKKYLETRSDYDDKIDESFLGKLTPEIEYNCQFKSEPHADLILSHLALA